MYIGFDLFIFEGTLDSLLNIYLHYLQKDIFHGLVTCRFVIQKKNCTHIYTHSSQGVVCAIKGTTDL